MMKIFFFYLFMKELKHKLGKNEYKKFNLKNMKRFIIINIYLYEVMKNN